MLAVGIAGLTVVCAHQNEIVADISARPVKAAAVGMGPGGQLGFHGIGGVFVRHRQADKVRFQRLALPEAGIEIAVVNHQRAVGLAALFIPVDPERPERFCIKRLDPPAGQTDKDHALIIGGGRDRKAGGFAHAAFGQHLAGDGVHAVNAPLGIGDQVAVYQDGAAHGLAGIAIAQLAGPVERAVCRADGHFDIGDAVVGVIGAAGDQRVLHRIIGIARAAEIRPFRLHRPIQSAVFRRGSKRQRQHGAELALFLCKNGRLRAVGARHDRLARLVIVNAQGTADADIARRGEHIAIPEALGKAPCAGLVRPEALPGGGIVQNQQRIFRLDRCAKRHRRDLFDRQRKIRLRVGAFGAAHADHDGLRLIRPFQLHHARVRRHFLAVQQHIVACVRLPKGHGNAAPERRRDRKGARPHGHRHGIFRAIRRIVRLQQEGSAGIFCGEGIQRQRALHGDDIILIVGDPVLQQRGADGQRVPQRV